MKTTFDTTIGNPEHFPGLWWTLEWQIEEDSIVFQCGNPREHDQLTQSIGFSVCAVLG